MATVISVAAVVISAMSFAFGWWRWRQERQDRKSEVNAERQARLAAEVAEDERRRSERDDVVVTVRFVVNTQTGLQEPWWRLQVAGGNAYSRTTITRLWLYVGDGRASQPDPDEGPDDGTWQDLLRPHHELHLVAGQQRHIKAARGASLRDPLVHQVYVRWTTGDSSQSSMVDVNLEPWQ